MFEPIANLPGFRRIADGPVSGGAIAFITLNGGADGPADSLLIRDGTFCAALFGPARDPARVPIAYFTDYRCLYCRKVSPMLARLAAGGTAQVSWHDLPLLGNPSVAAARAAVAARAQGAYDVFHHRLMGTPVLPTPAYLRTLAGEAGIDAERLLRDMSADETDHQL